MKEILIATSNQHKIAEYQAMLEGYGYEIKSLNDYPPMTIEETGTSFAENALIKARALFKLTHMRVIADDSGLEIGALNNEPGIYSARYLGEKTPYDQKNRIILERMKDQTDRRARFICAIALVDGDGENTFIGEFNGTVALKPSGSNGFGYDPIFFLEEYQMTAAEMPPEQKNQISHRGKALKLVLPYLLNKDGYYE
ncbi:dITP/XTP pyrophosphatase [bioreactor metagenome]|uniref:dITP/XTP pyrophosphatase n=1 Tax=bioreactor metagenome TaxID=1076179 RepID=A0A645AI37_9ZZZZ|nr:RdgB/HAM1 family non-canonical purine NTP pyrophosphatase [Erysipelotrichaceae bacterium]